MALPGVGDVKRRQAVSSAPVFKATSCPHIDIRTTIQESVDAARGGEVEDIRKAGDDDVERREAQVIGCGERGAQADERLDGVNGALRTGALRNSGVQRSVTEQALSQACTVPDEELNAGDLPALGCLVKGGCSRPGPIV